jgi:hypothetical protein
MVSARYSKDANEIIGCGTRTFGDGFTWGFCQATDADEVSVGCYTENPVMLDAIAKLSAYSYIGFSWDEDGNCTYISSSTQSMYLPRNLGTNDKPGNNGQSGK